MESDDLVKQTHWEKEREKGIGREGERDDMHI